MRTRSLSLDERRNHPLPNGIKSDEPQPRPEHSLVVVAESDNRIVGTITAERVWCVSNFWIDTSLRGTGIAEQIAREIATLNGAGLTEMLCTENRHVQLLAYRMGFIPIKGVLFRH